MTTTQETWTIGRLLDWTTKFLSQKGSESPRLDTEVLLAHAYWRLLGFRADIDRRGHAMGALQIVGP